MSLPERKGHLKTLKEEIRRVSRHGTYCVIVIVVVNGEKLNGVTKTIKSEGTGRQTRPG